ncbi:MAG: hypothetical protein AAFR61_03640 [Bacteroidota bacterium]
MATPPFYRRKLPHLQPEQGTFDVCFRLHGSIPRNLLTSVWQDYAGKDNSEDITPGHKKAWLLIPEIAKLAMESLHFLEEEMKVCHLICYCIMPTHVHLMLNQCTKPLHQILKSHKQFVALRANRFLGRSGPFWQRESYDRLIRDETEFRRRVAYILRNPEKANLVRHWADWPYTYLSDEVVP